MLWRQLRQTPPLLRPDSLYSSMLKRQRRACRLQLQAAGRQGEVSGRGQGRDWPQPPPRAAAGPPSFPGSFSSAPLFAPTSHPAIPEPQPRALLPSHMETVHAHPPRCQPPPSHTHTHPFKLGGGLASSLCPNPDCKGPVASLPPFRCGDLTPAAENRTVFGDLAFTEPITSK